MTWISDPLFNALLRLSKYGRLALSREQVKGSNLLLFFLGTSVACLVMAYITGPKTTLQLAAGASGLLLMPASVIYRMPAGSRRLTMSLVTVALSLVALVGLGAITALDDFNVKSEDLAATAALCTRLFTTGLMISWLLVNFLGMQHVRR